MSERRAGLLKQALFESRSVFYTVGAFSLFINLAMLNAPIFMLQIYDRVLTSQSKETLLMLTILSVALLLLTGLVEIIRSRLLVRAGARLDTALSTETFGAALDPQQKGASPSSAALRDLDSLRTFLTGPGLLSLFDAPWTPIYLFIVFLLHPVLGVLALFGAVVILGLAYFNEFATRDALLEANFAHRDAESFVGTLQNNVEAAKTMGMVQNLQSRWQEHHRASLAWQALASDRGAILSSAAKVVRQGLQTLCLAIGAWLVLENQMSAGMIVAASIIMGRALAPVEATIGQWRSFVQAREAYRRLNSQLSGEVSARVVTELPPPEGHYRLQDVWMRFDGVKEPVLQGVSFELPAGKTLGIVGASGAGKSTLARLMIGLWPPARGSVRLDGVEMSDWPGGQIGPYVGYLPQDVELLDGTVAENIARYGQHNSEKIVEAAKIAGAHEFIASLAQGYDTEIGDRGKLLSGGQRQRVALARAIYGLTRIIILDEPNANLDTSGEADLRTAVRALKRQGRTIIMVTHRPSILQDVDMLAVMNQGRLTNFGPRDEVLRALSKAAPAAAAAAAPAPQQSGVIPLRVKDVKEGVASNDSGN
jgi:PrtD family type I secretion system ABC transporter